MNMPIGGLADHGDKVYNCRWEWDLLAINHQLEISIGRKIERGNGAEGI